MSHWSRDRKRSLIPNPKRYPLRRQCAALDVVERLPCDMLVQGVAAYTTRVRAPLFNENRMSEIWPEDLAELRTHAWRYDDSAYQNIRKYGGYLLLRPLVREFGVVRTLKYIAGTPFRIEQNNVRLSAERYQQRALQALGDARSVNAVVVSVGPAS